jgi:uncharacterized Rmd1/YagE family protein
VHWISIGNMSQRSIRGPRSGKFVQIQSSHSDGEYDYQVISDEEENEEFSNFTHFIAPKLVKTGRERKRLAARTKGGEFAARRRKRRVYFCCIASDLDIQKLYDYLIGAEGMLNGWKYQLTPDGDVLHLYKAGAEDIQTHSNSQINLLSSEDVPSPSNSSKSPLSMANLQYEGMEKEYGSNAIMQSNKFDNSLKFLSRTQEVYVFDFGAAVFWGFSRGEETNLLKTIKMFVTKGVVGKDEFMSGEDDMAFSPSDSNDFSIANDFITLHDDAPVKQRMSISYAIAQSSVLAVFEGRIDRKIEDSKYIPETLAQVGKVHLSEHQLGRMIGEVFVIRHDVNLHTEILDTPAFFWNEAQFEENYRTVMDYLEMEGRTNILNKRLDMLRELLDVLQHQMENEHGVKLEWIVIWLIVAEVAVQLLATFYSDGGSPLGR